MTTEERVRFEVLVESLQRDMRVIAEGHGALVEGQAALAVRLDRFDGRFDKLEMKVDTLGGDMQGVQGRLKRIEAHLKLNGSSPGPKATSNPTPKRRKKS